MKMNLRDADFWKIMIIISAIILGENRVNIANDRKPLSQRIVALVSTNPPPKLVKSRSRVAAEFDSGFDWNEQNRVIAAVRSLCEDTTEAEWEELLLAGKDERYSITVRVSEEPSAGNLTVGDICSKLAVSRLIDVFDQHLVGEFDQHLKRGFPRLSLYKYLGILGPSLADWRNMAERKSRPLRLLQVEVCERSIEYIKKELKAPEEKKLEMIKSIQSEVDRMAVTGKPVFVRLSTRWLDAYTKDPTE